MLPRVFEVLLSVDFDVAAWRVDMCHPMPGFDHVLKQVNEIRLLKDFRFSERLTGELFSTLMKVRPQRSGSAC